MIQIKEEPMCINKKGPEQEGKYRRNAEPSKDDKVPYPKGKEIPIQQRTQYPRWQGTL